MFTKGTVTSVRVLLGTAIHLTVLNDDAIIIAIRTHAIIFHTCMLL